MSSNGNNQDDTRHYEGALLEDIQDKIKLLTEAMAEVPADVRQLKQDVSEMKSDLAFVKHAVTEQSSDLDNHEQRLQQLERRAA